VHLTFGFSRSAFHRLLAAVVATCLFAVAHPAAAQQQPRFSINGHGPCIFPSLQQALAMPRVDPNTPNQIVVRAGTYNVLAAAGADGVNISNDDVHIFGGDANCEKVWDPTWGTGFTAASVTYRAPNGTRIFTVENGKSVWLLNFALDGGTAARGGLVSLSDQGPSWGFRTCAWCTGRPPWTGAASTRTIAV
jgi:hypothetical protein